MTQFQVSHDGTAYRVYATEFGVDRTYFREMFENPRAAIAFSDSQVSPPSELPLGVDDGLTEAPDPVLVASPLRPRAAPSPAVPPVAGEGLPTLGL